MQLDHDEYYSKNTKLGEKRGVA